MKEFNKFLFESLGGTYVRFSYNGVEYVSVGYKEAGEVELRALDGSVISLAGELLIVEFEDNIEQAFCEAIELPSGFYFEHIGKTEYDLALDVGQWLASVE